MVRKRPVATPQLNERSEEEYLEAPSREDSSLGSPEWMSVDERIQRREAGGAKRSLMPIFGNEEHKHLISEAAKIEGVSKQALLRMILYPELERRYGDQISFLD